MNYVKGQKLPPFPGEGPKPAKGRALTDGQQPGDAALTWYVLRTATRQEVRAEENLIHLGYVVYVPRLKRWARSARAKYVVERPLFDGYMFVGLGPGMSLASLSDIEGVSGVVSFSADRDPRPVSFADIAVVAAEELAGEYDRTGVVEPTLKAGDRVRMTGGKFAGFTGQVVRLEKNARIRLLFELFGRQSPLVEKIANVEPLVEAD